MRSSRIGLVLLLCLLWVGSPPRAQSACDPALESYAELRCELDATRSPALCDPLHPTLRRTVNRRVKQALRGAARAEASRKVRRSLQRVDASLEKIRKKARRLRRADRIPETCALTVSQRIATLRSLVSVLLAAVPTAPPGLPGFVAGYAGWPRLNDEPIPPRQGGDAHLGTKNVYVNQDRMALAPAGAQVFPYPDGTILVKESTRPGADFVGLVAVMRKRSGSDPAHGDWLFVEYSRTSATARFRLLARDGVCFGCHQAALDSDWVFTTLPPP
jgi:hypothetical protein